MERFVFASTYSFIAQSGMTMGRIHEKRVIGTRGGGFLGFFAVKEMRKRGRQKIAIPRSAEHNLRRTVEWPWEIIEAVATVPTGQPA